MAKIGLAGWRPPPARAPVDTPVPAALLLKAMESAANAMFVTDRKGRILWVNTAFTRLSGFALAEVLGQTPRVLRSGRQSSAFYRELWRTIISGQTWRGRLVNRTKAGGWYDVGQTISPIRGTDGRITHFLAVHEDIHDQLRNERRLSQDAMFDPGTKLPNHNLLRMRLVDAVARAKRSGRFMAVLAVEIEGRPGGDGDREWPGHVAARLRAIVRQTDLFAKAAGDGFAVVIEDLGAPVLAAHLALRVLEALAEPLPVAGKAVHIEARIGVAVHPGDGESPEVLLQTASDAAAAARKKSPRICFADPGIGVAARRILAKAPAG